jgi:WD40 repeat protein/tRNA A-37 threonylcarbamoyl transferase component Bud32
LDEHEGDLSGHEIKGYQLHELIGSGGFAEVYRAYQPSVGREVAVKIILAQYANHPDFIRRFEAEAQLIARLEHIHIVPLYDYWREPDGAYLVMRWLKGGSLRDLLANGQPLELSLIRHVLDQISAALATAHHMGIIHQDLKPDNVLLDDARNAFLADFGIAKDLFARDADHEAEDGLGFGTPAYVSPEQVLQQPVTPQSDIYSLGIMLYELLTARTPFIATAQTTLMQKHVKEPLPSLQILRPDLPRQLSVVLSRACAKKPEARYTTTLELAAAFRDALPEDLIPVMELPAVDNILGTSSADPTAQVTGPHTLILQSVMEVQNPFKGLRPFQEADAADFFGRKRLVEHLLDVVEAEPARFLSVIGPSGSGKSSLIRAGLIPALRRGMLSGSEKWYIAQMTPGADPFKSLEAAILQVAVGTPSNLIDQLRKSADGLLQAVRRIVPLDGEQIILFIDQFEELFTLAESESERALFLENLHSAVTGPDSPLRIIITLRADFYDRPLLYPGFGELVKACTEVVLPLTPGELEQTVVGPAQRVGLQLERGLVAAIIADVSQQPGALPLLQYALTELFERRTGDTLTLSAYHAIGGVAGALARRAEALYDGFDEARQAATRRLFLQIAATSEGAEDTRRRVPRRALLESAHNPELMTEVIDLFGRYRLLAFDREPETRAPTVEIAHEALIRQWEQLREWLSENRDDLRTYRRLAAAAGDWVRAGRDPSFLATGARLAQFSTLAETDSIALSADETAYLEASIVQRQRMLNRLRAVVAVLVLGLLLVSGLAIFALDRQQQAQSAEATAVAERDRADQQARISRSRELAITALTTDALDLALLLSLEALEAAQTFEARSSLLTALRAEPRLFAFLGGHSGGVRAVAYNAAGDLLASAGQDAVIRLWDMDSRQLAIDPLAGHEDWINALVFDPNGDYLASASADGTVRRWDAITGEEIGAPLVTEASLWGLAVSADGTQTAASGADGYITLWDATTGESIGPPLRSHEGIVYAVAFSADGALLASGGDDNAVRLWPLADEGASSSSVIAKHDNWVLSVAFSPDGALLASGGADGAIIIRDVDTEDIIARIDGAHDNWIRHLAFDAAGQILASAGADGVIRLWDAHSGGEIAPALTGHRAAIWSAAFSPSGDLLAAGDVGGELIVWDAGERHGLDVFVGAHEAEVFTVAVSPDGERVVSGGGDPGGIHNDNDLRVWALDGEPGAEPLLLEGHSGPVMAAAFSPDGARIASSGAEGRIIVWDAATGIRDDMLTGGRGSINAVSFSPDGDYIAGAGDDGAVIIWPVTGGADQTLAAGEGRLLSLAYSPDGALLAAGGDDGTVWAWDPRSGERIPAALDGHSDMITSLAFSPDGALLASGSRDNTLILWDTVSWQPVHGALTAHSNWVLSAAFSADGALLASGSRDGTLILWDVASGRAIGRPLVVGTGDWVNHVAFSPVADMLITGGRDGSVIRWDVSLDSWRRRACRVANRALTLDEWTRYLGESAYTPACD